MLSAIFRKEYYKIRRPWLMILLFNLAMAVYLFVTTRQLFIQDHAEIVWYRVIHLGQIHYEALRVVPVLSGVLLACVQYLPEMWGERLKLSLHLPISPHLLILFHTWVGLAAFVLVCLPSFSGLWWITAHFFPGHAVITSLVTALPWYLAGIAAYLGSTLVLLEPNTRLKCINLCIAAGMAGLFLKDTEPGSYGLTIPVLIPALVLMGISVLLPAFRFRYRRSF